MIIKDNQQTSNRNQISIKIVLFMQWTEILHQARETKSYTNLIQDMKMEIERGNQINMKTEYNMIKVETKINSDIKLWTDSKIGSSKLHKGNLSKGRNIEIKDRGLHNKMKIKW